jgi:hypothetical protein
VAQQGTWNVTNVSGTVSLPTGAATSAKQPAFGTAGTASADVLTVQGVASMTPLLVNGSGVTQPVSGPLTDVQLRASAVPMSLAALPALAAGANNIGDVDVLTLPALAAGTNLVGKVGIDQTTPGTTNKVSIGTDGTVAINAALPAGTNAIGKLAANSGVDIGDVDVTSITPPTLTKGTQGATGFSVQDLKDAGRTTTIFRAVAAAAGTTTTETAITLTKSAGTAATSTGTSFVVTSGKRYRITHLTFATRGHNTATAQTTTFNLRINTAGAVTTSSTPIIFSARSATPAVANDWDRATFEVPDGIEILGDGTLQFGVTAAATYTTNAPTWDVSLIGFEY